MKMCFKKDNSVRIVYLWAWIRALNPNPFLQLPVKFVMLTPGYLKHKPYHQDFLRETFIYIEKHRGNSFNT